ncbi:hypothetical protein Anas_11681 [Armadillidium nasatum]|uniref:Uncharacterized protein n=1 Tax=Armadillidium nasatum TaxID=96803 RepID=A0A5N5T1J3_9CRUS|nr:hypothetical protein Anas_11681 [Armadillidium nasatum]
MPFIPSGIECNINIEPQYDGVVMLSSDVAFFNDAKPRPDGRKIYHIFEHSGDEHQGETPDKSTKEFDSRKKELFAKASENSIQNIQQILAKNGISMQEWCPSLSSSATQILQANAGHPLSDSCNLESNDTASQYSLALPSVDNQEILTTILTQRMITPIFITDDFDLLLDIHTFKLYKVYQFYINFPAELQSSASKNRLTKRLNKRGIFNIQYEPENFLITLKTHRSAQFILKILRKIDQNVFLLSTTYDLVLNDNDSEETLSNINCFNSL